MVELLAGLLALGIAIWLVVRHVAGPQTANLLAGRTFSGLGRLLGRFAEAAARAFALLTGAAARGAGGGWSLRGHGSTAILAPGDRAPSPQQNVDWHDYRAVATIRDVQGLRAPGLRLGRVLHPRGRLGPEVALPPPSLHRSAAVIGPPGAGKTAGIIVPWIENLLALGQSVVTVDVKGDLFDTLAPFAQSQGVTVWYWSCSDPRSMAWNFMDGLQDFRAVEATVQSLLGRPRPNDAQPFFYERDYRWLRALLQIVKTAHGAQATPRHLYSIVSDQDLLRHTFRVTPAAQPMAGEVADLLQFALDEHAQAISGLMNALHLFSTPEVERITTHSDFLLPGIGRQPTLLVIGAALADARAGETLSSVILNQLCSFIYRRFSPGGSRKALPLGLIIDEAARLKDRLNYEEILAVVRSAGIGTCLAVQDVTQFGDEREQNAILSNCQTMVVFPGCSQETARHLGGRLGQRTIQTVTANRNRGPYDLFHQVGNSQQLATVPVLAEREIMHLPVGRYPATVHSPHLCAKPILVELTR